ncbi:unnamed protein product, partial [Heterotrigona itama]
MARRQSRRTTVHDNEFESDDNDCLEDIERQFRRMCASEIESDEDSEDMVTFRQRRRINRISDTSESDNETDQNSDWQNVTENDTYSSSIEFSTGDKVQGPQVPSNCITPLQFFSLFFTNELVSKIATETNLYARKIINSREVSVHSLWYNWYDVTVNELRAFLETTRQTDDKERTSVDKVAYFLSYLDEKFRHHFVPAQNISVDESIVGFKGRISFKMYNAKKPNKWGLRLYALVDSSSGYLYTFLPYFGKQTTDALIHPDLPVTSRIVLHLYNNLQQSIPEATGYHIFTDRLYTSIILG